MSMKVASAVSFAVVVAALLKKKFRSKPTAEVGEISTEYEVFLSFRGPDTRQAFTDCLYHALVDVGILTFMDDESLRTGEEIDGDLLKAIQQSKISIPIFSKDYASSEWCLKELTLMLERGNHMILPVFYDVDPSEVKDQIGEYGRALEKHMEKINPNIVVQWKAALTEVGRLKGMDLVELANGYQGQLIKLIVSKVVSQLSKADQLIDHLVGTDDHIEAVKLPMPELAYVSTEAQGSGSSGDPSPSSGYEYDVFLSFRGSDTLRGFMDLLYRNLLSVGIHAFLDSEELPFGEKSDSIILKAIKGSRISIPIFSKDYASSKWCLRELTYMLECEKKGEHMILPVYYDVTQDEVRYQTGGYGIPFHKQEKMYDSEIAQQWREALSEVGRLKGMDLVTLANRDEGRLVELLVSRVLRDLKKAQPFATDNLVGIDDPVKAVEQLLELGAHDVKILGIWGMAGSGKTTLAKVIYNQVLGDFDCYSFISNVGETSRLKGLHFLQSLLVSDLSRCEPSYVKRFEEGDDIIIKGRFRRKKVLIVLDDVDDTIQLDDLGIEHDSFGPASRVIVTSRNRNAFGWDKLDCIYEVEPMNEDHALKFFCKYAFGRDTPPDEFSGLSQDIVQTTEGLPLALEVLGSSLCGKSKGTWECMLNKLKMVPPREVQGELDLIYEALDHGHKQMFLDIACLFIGKDINGIFPMWDDCEFFPQDGIDVLVAYSLIKIGDDDNKIWMHNQIRDFGRKIVRSERPGTRSRLWDKEEANYVLTNEMGSSNVEAIRMHMEPCCFTSKHFRNLLNLRFLDLDDCVRLDGDFKNLLPSLRWLRWSHSSAFSSMINLYLPNLVILELERNNLKDDWTGWSSIQMMKLKVLNLKFSQNLERTPDFSAFPHLERLTLSYCFKLKVIDPSIAKLKNLIFLDISNCYCIEELPHQLDCLEKLEVLKADLCSRLASIPSSVSRLTSLTDLTLDSTCIKALPDSIGSLLSLRRLSLRHCKELSELPETIGIGSEKIRVLQGLSNSKLLESLKVQYCTNLEELVGVDQLHALKALDISWCKKIERLPDMSKFIQLKELCVSSCYKVQEIMGLDELKALTILRISDCKEIEYLPDLSKLKELKELHAAGCDKLLEIMGLGELKELTFLRISDCKEIEYLPDLSKLKQLKELHADGCEKLQELVGLGELNALTVLKISYTKEIYYLPSLSKLKQLKELWFEGCAELQELVGLDELKVLEILRISRCRKIQELPDLSTLGKLKVLVVGECEKLRELVGLGKLKALERLEILGCREIRMLPDLSQLNQLREFCARDCVNLQELVGLDKLEKLKIINILGCIGLKIRPSYRKSYEGALRDGVED